MQEQRPAPVPQVTIAKPRVNWFRELECRLTFHYGEHSARLGADPPAWYDRRWPSLVRRRGGREGGLRAIAGRRHAATVTTATTIRARPSSRRKR